MKSNMSGEEWVQSEVKIDGPGAQLRHARERQGIEQTRVAAQLHLNQAMIKALERDEYEKLPSAVFVRGYLRNYARLLGVDENAVISAYQTLNPNADPIPLPRNQPDEMARELHSNHGIIRYITWVVVLLMGVLIIFWWQGRMQLSETDDLASVEESQSGGPDLPLQDQMSLNPVPPESDFSLPPEEVAPIPDGKVTGLEPNLSEPPPKVPAQALDKQDSLPADADKAPLPVEDATPSIDLEAPPAVTQSPDRAAPSSAVLFEFLGPCWVEVRDATGRVRIIGEMRSGGRRTLDGTGSPYRVVIGDIKAVKLMVNGKAFDLKPLAQGKVARFTLDPAQP